MFNPCSALNARCVGPAEILSVYSHFLEYMTPGTCGTLPNRNMLVLVLVKGAT